LQEHREEELTMQATLRTDPWVWVKDDKGHRNLCPMGNLADPKIVRREEKRYCVDHDCRLGHPESVPGEGKLKFTQSRSPN
jgi:hypothetical protein